MLGRTFLVGLAGFIAALILPGSISVVVLFFTLGVVLLMVAGTALSRSVRGGSSKKEIR